MKSNLFEGNYYGVYNMGEVSIKDQVRRKGKLRRCLLSQDLHLNYSDMCLAGIIWKFSL